MEQSRSDIWEPDVLVIGPGGMKGLLELGALLYLEEINMLDKVNILVGCSVGSIICLLKICGYKASDIINEAISVSVFDFVNVTMKDVKDRMGLMNTSKIRSKLESMVKRKWGLIPTLQQLYATTGKILTVVAYNTSRVRTEYINRDNHPSMSCVDAVMLSSNIPLLFQTAMFDGSTYIDGALGNPYPIDIYDDGKLNILGIYITSLASPSTCSSRYLWKIAQCPMNELINRIKDSCSHRCKHIVLESPTIDTTGLTFTNETKTKLVISGWDRAKAFAKSLGLGEDLPIRPDFLKSITDDHGNMFYEEPGDTDGYPEPTVEDGVIMVPVTPRVRDIIKNTDGTYIIRLSKSASDGI